MSFDPYANQGGAAAWDPDAAAASKKAAEELFAKAQPAEPDEHGDIDADRAEAIQAESEQPGEVPDPDLATD